MKQVAEIVLLIVLVFFLTGAGAFFWTSAKENKARAKLLDALEKGKIPLHKPCCQEKEPNCDCENYQEPTSLPTAT